ncbi:MAG: ATP-dependent helicase HrpB [Candidatus Cohnella colombiensis]|uniref:ATP-dependent helicase HrpB n=1 Tax=Candidatus Cohnella colombiensis TaxID=3121368 RepID=A0AA95EZF9_9BACL|nr:MAG: ATP-dependent helicase HrpB [Cohnella sp.]
MKMPIDAVLPELKHALQQHRNAVLVAAPGAGKTTRIPLALLDEPWLNKKKIIMLEPRRLAARSAAKYMAKTLNEAVGETVGYRVRLETKVGPQTRIEVVTEGVLTRMLQSDPTLEGIGLLIFDEFHERSLQADLGLALSIQAQQLLRDDIKILVMSATLEAEPVAQLLGNATVIVSEGRQYGVDTLYRPRSNNIKIEDAIPSVIVEALNNHEGDLLVFLPGMREIRRVEERLLRVLTSTAPSVRICPLHGSLSMEEQDAALSPVSKDQRKVVLSTSVAETSLTVEGITVVIDSGLSRVSRFSPRTGMSRLETITVSAASAEQRKGRAGRIMPGTCYRLWSEEEHTALSPRTSPEIMETDLAPLLLELSLWGVHAPSELNWLDEPPNAAVQQARELLIQLGAIDSANYSATPHGRDMAVLGIHPRIAHMLLRALPLGSGELACEIAIVLSEGDIVKGVNGNGRAIGADLRLRVEAMRSTSDRVARNRYTEGVRRLMRLLSIDETHTLASTSLQDCGLLLAYAYPDRIARRRDNGKYLLSGGRGATFIGEQLLAQEQWIVVADVDDHGADSRIRLATPINFEQIMLQQTEWISEETHIFWDRESQSVRARVRKKLGAIELGEVPMTRPPADRVLIALLEGVETEGIELLPWTKAARQYQERVMFMCLHESSWPDVADDALLATLGHWLAPYVEGIKSRAELQRVNLKELLESQLSWEQRRQLDQDAPTHWTVPSGSRIPIDYHDKEAPILAVRLQELFGMAETPRIAGGKVALTLHLLSPAQRPVQVTRDLASFWQQTYFEVRKDLKGRYPKHYWPDNPLEAQATRRAKPPGGS